jgi:hypothetical protein
MIITKDNGGIKEYVMDTKGSWVIIPTSVFIGMAVNVVANEAFHLEWHVSALISLGVCMLVDISYLFILWKLRGKSQ